MKYVINLKYTLAAVLLLVATASSAQKNDRDFLRRGNRCYHDSLFQKAEVNYRKALEVNPKSTRAMYNLGNALLMQQKPKEAMQQYEAASKIEKNKMRSSMIYHNAGVIFQSQQLYADAIEMYKQSLRNNPEDNETRYNLILCQHLLKKNPQQDKDKQNQDKDKDKQNQDKDKQNQDKDKQDKDKQNQDKDKQDKDKQNQDKDKQNKDKQNQDKQDRQQPEDKNQMSKENAEQLLNAAMQDEKQTQEKMKRISAPSRSRKLQKDW